MVPFTYVPERYSGVSHKGVSHVLCAYVSILSNAVAVAKFFVHLHVLAVIIIAWGAALTGLWQRRVCVLSTVHVCTSNLNQLLY